MGRRFPVAEAETMAGTSTRAEFALLAGVTTRAVCRWRSNGLSLLQADRLACRLGYNPGSIWPEWFDASDEAVA